MPKDFHLYLRLLKYIRPYWKIVWISLLGMVVSAALEPVLPALMQPLIDKSLIQRNDTSLWQVPLFIVIAFVLKGFADYVATVASQTVAQKVIADLRGVIFSHQLLLSIGRHRSEPSGRMLSRITYDTSMVGEAVSTVWLTLIRDMLVLIGLLAFLFYTAWQLALLVISIAPILGFAIRKFNSRIRSSSERVQGWMGRVTGHVEETLIGLREIKIFGAHRLQSERFDLINQGLRREQTRVARVQAINVPLVQILAACSVALVLYAASILGRQDLLTPGEFVSFIAAMTMVFEPVRRLTNVNATLQRGLAASESIFHILDGRNEQQNSENSNLIDRTTAELRGRIAHPPTIEFKNVEYKYPGAEHCAPSDFTEFVRAGECIVLVGPSGSGKTTLLDIVAGFDEPKRGDIFISGVPIGQFPVEFLRSLVSYVGQHTILFDLTISENLRIADPNASEELIYEALDYADALSFVEQMPLGVNTPLGTLGGALSGGQRQRLSIARAYIKKSPILLLDEPTSALDRTSEVNVLKSLKKVIHQKTTIIVTHAPERFEGLGRVVELKRQFGKELNSTLIGSPRC